MNKIYLYLLSSVVLVSCSSKQPDSQPVNDRKVVQVEYVDDKKKRGSEFSDKYKKHSNNPQSGSELWRALTTKGVWYRMNDREEKLRNLLKKTPEQLGGLLNGKSAEETTLIVAALSEKGYPAIKYLARVLTDKRAAVFAEGSELYWYEKKNQPPEELELRIYAALHINKIATVKAFGVRFFLHHINTDKGIAEILYAAKGDYAVNKDDVSKNWIKWWDLNKEHYD